MTIDQLATKLDRIEALLERALSMPVSVLPESRNELRRLAELSPEERKAISRETVKRLKKRSNR